MNRFCALAVPVCLFATAAAAQDSSQPVEVGIIDTFGLDRVPEAQVRKVLTIAVGDRIPQSGPSPASLIESETRLLRLPNVVTAHIGRVCCDQGRLILFVGIQEVGAPVIRFRDAPTGTVSLEADVIEAGEEFEQALQSAVRRGQMTEDDSQGHALFNDAALRAIEERFIVYAARDASELHHVLRESSDPEQRALAVQVLAYTSDKQSVVDDLTFAMTDPVKGVRNNAMRALGVLTRMVPSDGHPVPRIPSAPFIPFLNSSVWTDRNKALSVLVMSSQQRDPELRAALREQAMTSLVEMARWKSKGHATPACVILGRLGELSEHDIVSACAIGGDPEGVIRAATHGH